MDGKSRLVWKLARNHTWGTPMDAETLVRLAATDEDHDKMRQYLDEVLELPFVARGPDGIYIPNGQDAHIAAANWLRENTEREDFVIGRWRAVYEIPKKQHPNIQREVGEAGYSCGLARKLHLGPADPTSRKAVRHAEERVDDGYGVFHRSHSSHQNHPGNEYRADWLQERDVEFELTPREESEYVFTSVPAEHHQTTWCAEKAVNFIEQATEAYEPTDFEAPAAEPWFFL